jgi:hypothetical protein
VNRVATVIDSRGFRMSFGAFSALILVAGLLAYFIVRSSSPAEPAAVPARQTAEHGPKISPPPVALRTARAFIRTAVLRTDLERAWDLTAPSFRRGYTESRWLSGTIPVVPFPAKAFVDARFKVVHSYADDILWLVTIDAKPGMGVKTSEFFIELVPVQGRWLVNYWGPRGESPPIPAAP